jgi:hypothetical protein
MTLKSNKTTKIQAHSHTTACETKLQQKEVTNLQTNSEQGKSKEKTSAVQKKQQLTTAICHDSSSSDSPKHTLYQADRAKHQGATILTSTNNPGGTNSIHKTYTPEY